MIKSMYVLLQLLRNLNYDEFKNRFPHAEKSEWFIRKPVGIEALIRKVESRSELQLKHNIDQTDIYL
jgi:hypothetical protein